MPTYINFLSFTEQGVKTIKDLPARIAAGRQAIEANGGKLLNYYLTMGAQDAVIVLEAPDDETVVSIALATAGLGNIRTASMRAFSAKCHNASDSLAHLLQMKALEIVV